jgi:hypothetical protein
MASVAARHQGANLETNGMHMAGDELSTLRRQLAALEAEDERGGPARDDDQEASKADDSPIGPSDVTLIAATLEVAYQERMLEEKLNSAALAERHAAETARFMDEELAARMRIESADGEMREGVTLMATSERGITEQRVRRREYNESKMREVEEWKAQAQRMDDFDKEFILHDRRKTEALAIRDEEQRAAEEAHWQQRRTAERQMMPYADEDELFTQEYLLSRLGLVRPTDNTSSR